MTAIYRCTYVNLSARDRKFSLTAVGFAASMLFSGGAYAACASAGNGGGIVAYDGGLCAPSGTYSQTGADTYAIAGGNNSTLSTAAPLTFNQVTSQYGLGVDMSFAGAPASPAFNATLGDLTVNLTGNGFGGAIRLRGTTAVAPAHVIVNGTLNFTAVASSASGQGNQGVAAYEVSSTIDLNGPYKYNSTGGAGSGSRGIYNQGIINAKGPVTCNYTLNSFSDPSTFNLCSTSIGGVTNVNGTFTVTGDAPSVYGVYSANGGAFNFKQAVTITPTDTENGQAGLLADKSGLASTISGAATASTTIKLRGAYSKGVWARGGTVTLAGSLSISNTGASAGPGAYFGTPVTAGIMAEQGGQVTTSNSVNVATTDSGAFGILITNANSTVDASASTGGAITSNGVALALKNGGAQTLKLNKSTITNTIGDLIQADAATGASTIALSNSTATANAAGNLFNVTNASTVMLTNTSTALSGPILTDGGSTSTVNMDAPSTWSMTANSTLTNLNNAGIVTFTVPAGAFVAKTLTLPATGTLSGGGTIVLNTLLGNSSSLTDSVVMSGGTATGATKLTINNFGGAGAITTGDGILVVNKGSGVGTFVLSGPVTAGPYRYTLKKVGTSWYLQSVYDASLVPTVSPVPTLSEKMLLLLSALLAGGVALRLRKKNRN